MFWVCSGLSVSFSEEVSLRLPVHAAQEMANAKHEPKLLVFAIVSLQIGRRLVSHLVHRVDHRFITLLLERPLVRCR